MDELVLQRGEEAPCPRVVVTIAVPAHARKQAMCSHQATVVGAGLIICRDKAFDPRVR